MAMVRWVFTATTIVTLSALAVSEDTEEETWRQQPAGWREPGPKYGAPAPANNYGAPAPANNYGAPAPANNYGAPAPAPRWNAPAPANNYGAPAPAPRWNAPAPANNYGAPAPAPRWNAPAPRWGAPTPTNEDSCEAAVQDAKRVLQIHTAMSELCAKCVKDKPKGITCTNFVAGSKEDEKLKALVGPNANALKFRYFVLNDFQGTSQVYLPDDLEGDFDQCMASSSKYLSKTLAHVHSKCIEAADDSKGATCFAQANTLVTGDVLKIIEGESCPLQEPVMCMPAGDFTDPDADCLCESKLGLETVAQSTVFSCPFGICPTITLSPDNVAAVSIQTADNTTVNVRTDDCRDSVVIVHTEDAPPTPVPSPSPSPSPPAPTFTISTYSLIPSDGRDLSTCENDKKCIGASQFSFNLPSKQAEPIFEGNFVKVSICKERETDALVDGPIRQVTSVSNTFTCGSGFKEVDVSFTNAAGKQLLFAKNNGMTMSVNPMNQCFSFTDSEKGRCVSKALYKVCNSTGSEFIFEDNFGDHCAVEVIDNKLVLNGVMLNDSADPSTAVEFKEAKFCTTDIPKKTEEKKWQWKGAAPPPWGWEEEENKAQAAASGEKKCTSKAACLIAADKPCSRECPRVKPELTTWSRVVQCYNHHVQKAWGSGGSAWKEQAERWAGMVGLQLSLDDSGVKENSQTAMATVVVGTFMIGVIAGTILV